MIQKLAKLGKIIPKDMFPDNPLGLSWEYNVDDIVFLCFRIDEETCDFDGISVEKYSQANTSKYLMKAAKGRATSEFPTLDIFSITGLKEEPKQAFSEDAQKQLKIDLNESKYGKKLIYILSKHRPLFDGIVKEIKENQDIATQLTERLIDFQRFALSIKINGHYIGEYPEFQKTINGIKSRVGNSEFYTLLEGKKRKKYIAHNKLCCVTNEISNELWGFVSIYNFYAVKTELAVIPGGFDVKQAWKNFPVSPSGAEYLDRAKLFLEKYLKFRFCGIDYFLIPEPILIQNNAEEYLSYIQVFQKFSISRDDKNLEEDLLDLLSDYDNSANYTLFFYKQNKREFKILASIEDVFPSYARKIHTVKKESEDHSIFKKLGKKDKYDLTFTFRHIKEFIPEQAAFLEIVRSIFMQKKIDYDYLLRRVVNKVQTDFANDELYQITILKAVLIFKLLLKLHLIPQIKPNKGVIMNNNYEHFFEEHSEFFNSGDSATKKAVFLEGVLIQNLLSIQFQERKATPFRSRLNSLKLNEKIIKRLLPEAIEKLEQYGKNYYRGLEESISHYLLNSKFDLSDNEISFYFTMGMNLAKEFKSEKENQPTNGE